jgi:hypothetical protein
MLGSKRLEVQFDIEALLFIDGILIVSWVLPIFFSLQDPVNLTSGVLITGWGLLVILLVSGIIFLHIYLVVLPRRIRRRFEFTEEVINWDGPLGIPERLHLLDPGYERVGIFPSWKCGTAVAMGLLANLVMDRVVEITPPLRKDGTQKRGLPTNWWRITITSTPNRSPSDITRSADPIGLAVLDRYMGRPPRERINVRDWKFMCRESRLSINDAILTRLAHKGYLQETRFRRVGIFKQPSFTLTEKGQANRKAEMIQDYLQTGTLPRNPQDQFILFLACSGGIGLPKRSRKEQADVKKQTATVKAVLPAGLKLIADAIEEMDKDDQMAVAV